jgi:hypothetical protein
MKSQKSIFLIACFYATLGDASSPNEISNNLNNINDLKFYHQIRGNLTKPARLRRLLRVLEHNPVVHLGQRDGAANGLQVQVGREAFQRM